MNSTEKGIIGEDFVNGVAFNSFLEYWCYPSPKDEKGDAKEICDLLIVFDTTLIIISVKNYEFKDLYSRYFRNTIDKAIKQIQGAERKLFSAERDIYIKHPNKQLERFHKEKIENIFRVIVNLGEGVRFYPFNKLTKDEKFITLLDRDAFETIVKELDTIPDFVEYLSKREQLFSDKVVTILPGEEEDFSSETANQFFEYAQEQFNPRNTTSILISGTEHDLLALYLKNERAFPNYFSSEENNGMLIQLDGNWEDFSSKNQVIKKKELDRNSYFLDELVKREILIHDNDNSTELAKAIMSFNRFYRRLISDNFLSFFDSYKNSIGNVFARRYADFEGTGVVFAFYTQETPQETVNILLDIAMDSFCVYSKYQSKKMILIATTTDFKQFKMGVMKDIKPFPKEKERQVMEDAKSLGWFTNHQEIRVTENEYPEE